MRYKLSEPCIMEGYESNMSVAMQANGSGLSTGVSGSVHASRLHRRLRRHQRTAHGHPAQCIWHELACKSCDSPLQRPQRLPYEVSRAKIEVDTRTVEQQLLNGIDGLGDFKSLLDLLLCEGVLFWSLGKLLVYRIPGYAVYYFTVLSQ